MPRGDLASYARPAFLGIDAGSTTIKAALVGEDGELLWTWYGTNNGDVLGTDAPSWPHLRADSRGLPIGGIATHHGLRRGLLIEALHADSGEIETVATCAARRPSCRACSSSWTSAART